MATTHAAELLGLQWSRYLDQRRPVAAVAALSEAMPRRLVMDEFAIYKAHRYASVVHNADARRALCIGLDRSRKDLRPFFEPQGPVGCARIEAVARDMNTAFWKCGATAPTPTWSTSWRGGPHGSSG